MILACLRIVEKERGTRSVFLALCEAVDNTFNIQPLVFGSTPAHDQLIHIPIGMES